MAAEARVDGFELCPPQQSMRDLVFQLIFAGCMVFVLRLRNGFGFLTAVWSSSLLGGAVAELVGSGDDAFSSSSGGLAATF